MQINDSNEDVKQNKVVKLYPDENHSNFLRAELRHMFENEHYLDTELRCSDKRILRVNKLIAALAFPELSASASYGNHRADQTVLLPDSTFENVKRIIDVLFSDVVLSGGTTSSHFDVSHVKHEEIEVQSPESIDQRSFDNLEDCSEDYLDNESENRDILLEDCVLKQPEEKKGYKPRSLTWKYFTKSKNSENVDIGECNECFAEIKTASGNTSGLKTHLRSNHKSLYEELVKNNSAKAKEIIETIGQRSFNNFEDCSENCVDNDIFLKDSVLNHSEEKRGYKVRSLTWNYFTKSKNAENFDIGKCNQCSAEIKTSSGNTSGLKTHLKSNHKTLYKEFVKNNSARARRISTNCVKDGDKIRHRSSSRAYVWEYFSKNVTGPSTGPSGTCLLCQKVIKTPTCSTSGLIKHLESMHLEIFQEICYKCKTGLEPNHPNLQCAECQCRFHEDCIVFLGDSDSWVCAVCDQRKIDVMARKAQDAKQKLKLKKLCPECGNAYRNLQQHIKKMHQGIKYHQPSECDICKKMFSTKSHLKTHVKTVHNGEKNYCCKFCERAFSVKSQLKRHLLCMHQGYKVNQNSVCPDCGRRFRLKASMSKHRRVVHLGIKKSDNAVCDECGQNFTQRGTLYLHLRKVHGKEPAVINQNMVGKMSAENSYVEPSLILEAYPDIGMDLGNESSGIFHKEGCQQ